ncbi:MAG TPA: peptidoglycan-binding domain-containing protein [Chthoniobacteraceae bacterium]|nr:peptidoglycan-binding domain-containing protein [Chthoniobacteraceae bacterium]
MKLSRILPAILLALSTSLFADELVKGAQSELKSQGFYYAEITGVNNPETVAAVKRYQIRNGLEVTGTLTKETLEALGVGSDAPVASTQPPPTLEAPQKKVEPTQRPPVTSRQIPPVNLRRTPNQQDSDREFLKDKESPRPPEPQAPASPPTQRSSGAYGHVFARTPYATAPLEVQQSTLQRAQKFMRELGFYRDPITGQPGPATEEAILGYQRFVRLPLTGQLDMETLAAMRLLPGRGGAPMRSASGQRRTLRGVLID